ncbi:ubiquitin carboxyl-terminal hydrolase 8 [Angomonas deanei]|uniref:Ubiquitin carboxyl-terminal hydrolase, putative n=1 Tax=Angomonas deanei TaxID=59799 RepID=A0A7G2CNY2_9TRYP|nr:ubiquitin carboxyl-terminal hydrolase 8 [Angomonas deanei]CAD2220817.1 Ubiquitin carboxyl-terminal hydrolase, putative [Angomonas deanei]|eukprot:EPY21455.1 ubiquitin carboxyl-terminal hydrolase 8 [Angomonas deanei]
MADRPPKEAVADECGASFLSQFETEENVSGILKKRDEFLDASLAGPYLSYTKGSKPTRTLDVSSATIEFNDECRTVKLTKSGNALKGESSFNKLFEVEKPTEYFRWKAALSRATFLWDSDEEGSGSISEKRATPLSQALRCIVEGELLFSFIKTLEIFDAEEVEEMIDKKPFTVSEEGELSVGEGSTALSTVVLLGELNSAIIIQLVGLHHAALEALECIASKAFSVYNTPLKLKLEYASFMNTQKATIRRVCRLFVNNVLQFSRNVMHLADHLLDTEVTLGEALQQYTSYAPKAPWFSLNAFLLGEIKTFLRNTVVVAESHGRGGGPGLVGAVNLGNTCYLNSTLQCLLHTPALSRFFFIPAHRVFSQSEEDVALSGAFHSLVRDSWVYGKELDPEVFLELVRGKEKIFKRGEQHDAHEMFITILEKMEKELKSSIFPFVSKEKRDNCVLPSHTVNNDTDDLIHRWWMAFVNRQYSVITHFFYGQIVQKIHCESCDRSSYSCESFNFLFIPLKTHSSDSKRKNTVPIEDCLDEYFKRETVSMDWKCDLCQAVTSNPKLSLGLHRLPPYLVVCVNRFKKDEKGRFREKSGLHLQFGHRIRLGSYMTESAVFPGFGEDGIQYFSDSDQSPSRRGKYYLYACVCHSGTASRGHYYAVCRVSNRWWTFSDTSVRREKNPPWESSKVSSEVYLLFYASSAGFKELVR